MNEVKQKRLQKLNNKMSGRSEEVKNFINVLADIYDKDTDVEIHITITNKNDEILICTNNKSAKVVLSRDGSSFIIRDRGCDNNMFIIFIENIKSVIKLSPKQPYYKLKYNSVLGDADIKLSVFSNS